MKLTKNGLFVVAEFSPTNISQYQYESISYSFIGTDSVSINVISNSKFITNLFTGLISGITDVNDTPYTQISINAFFGGFSNAGAITTGWASYIDTQYPDALNAFTIPDNTDTLIPNNAGSIIDSQKPADVITFYDGTVITGRNGDNLDIQIYFSAVPSLQNQFLTLWLDITGGTGTPTNLAFLYKQTFAFPRGAGVEAGVLYSLPSAYTLNTWETNGAVLKGFSNGDVDIYGINYNLDRSHKAI